MGAICGGRSAIRTANLWSSGGRRFSKNRARWLKKSAERKKKTGSLPARFLTLFVLLVLVALIGVAGLRLYRTMFVTARMPDLFRAGRGDGAAHGQQRGPDPEDGIRIQRSGGGMRLLTKPRGQRRGEAGRNGYGHDLRGNGASARAEAHGMAVEDAENVSACAGAFAGPMWKPCRAKSCAAWCFEQSPEAGTNAEPGAVVALTVSGGRVVVPELVGQREEEAVERMNAIGLTCGDIGYQNVETARQDGAWYSRNPSTKFTEVLPGSVVNMTVGRYDRRRYTAGVTVTVDVPQSSVTVRVTLVDENGQESDMYAATYNEEGRLELHVTPQKRDERRSHMAALSGWKLQERSDGGFAVKENYDGKHPAGNRQFLHRALRRGRTGIHPARTEKTASSENDADGRRPRPLYAWAGRGGRLAGGDSAAQKA